MATKSREIGRVTGYQRAGIQRVQIRAHLDERTTPCCRQLHGRVIEVQTLVDQRDAYFEAAARGNVDALKDIWVMHGAGTDLSITVFLRRRPSDGISASVLSPTLWPTISSDPRLKSFLPQTCRVGDTGMMRTRSGS